MTYQQLRKKKEGFTIIEVLIVLAIAGLILLIVFLAVPALQRNSRNTQLRNDASVLLGYVNDFSANNNGAVPVDVCYDAATGNVGMNASGTCSASTHLVGKIRAGLTANNGTANPGNTGELIVGLNRKCNGNTINNTTTSPRAVSVGFKAETAGTPQDQCVEG